MSVMYKLIEIACAFKLMSSSTNYKLSPSKIILSSSESVKVDD